MTSKQVPGLVTVAARRGPATIVGDLRNALDTLSQDLNVAWVRAIEAGSAGDQDRLVEASHAIRRAAIALRTDTLIPAS